MRLTLITLLLAGLGSPPALAVDQYALLVGIDRYSAMGKLITCRADARQLRKVLTERCGYDPARVTTLVDGEGDMKDQPTLANIKLNVKQVALAAGKDDALLFFLSGHGIEEDGQGYLVSVDGDGTSQTAVPLRWLKETISGSPARTKVVMLDACHAGSGAKGIGGISPSKADTTGGLIMLLSCGVREQSFPAEDGELSVFSKYLVAGMEGGADGDKDGFVTVQELFGFVREEMKLWCIQSNKTQTPMLTATESATQVLARIGQQGAGGNLVQPRVPQASATQLQAHAAWRRGTPPAGARGKAATRAWSAAEPGVLRLAFPPASAGEDSRGTRPHSTWAYAWRAVPAGQGRGDGL